jgi:hypothetical protein
MSNTPQSRPCYLFDGQSASTGIVHARLISDLPADYLVEVERCWFQARLELAAAMTAQGLHLESGHWDWRNKVWSIGSGVQRLFAVE